MADTLRAGVIGAGVFGGYHAQKWSTLPGAALAGVFDSHADRSGALAERLGSRSFREVDDLLDAVDLVSIATPAASHAPLILRALRAGKAVYAEKPLAVALADADLIVAESRRRGLVVACGFLERAAWAAIGLAAIAAQPTWVEARREGPPSPRNRDVSVVLDLMIHDIDLLLAAAGGAAPLAVEADGVRGPDGRLDEASAEITFDNGLTARLAASRVSAAPGRRMRLAYACGGVDIDFQTGALANTTPHKLDGLFAQRAPDRLRASLEAFAGAVRGERAPLADAADGARALDLALAVEHAAGG